MNIPDEAVEAALAANLAYKSQRSMDNAEKQMRAALEAAAPHMLAGAWDEGREADDYSVSIGFEKNPYRPTP